MHHFFETRKRSLLKALSWKIVATAISFNVLYLETGKIQESLQISGMVFIIGLLAYYFHERLWNSIHWEKSHATEHQKI